MQRYDQEQKISFDSHYRLICLHYCTLCISIKVSLTVMCHVMVCYSDLNYMAMVPEWSLIPALVESKTNIRLGQMLKGYIIIILYVMINYVSSDSYKILIFVHYRSELDEKLKMYNKYYEGRSGEIRSREVDCLKIHIFFLSESFINRIHFL